MPRGDGRIGIRGIQAGGENRCKRASFATGWVSGGAACEAFDGGLDGGEVVERIKAVGAAAEFPGVWGPRRSERQRMAVSSRRRLRTVLDVVFVFGDAGIARTGVMRCSIFKGVEGLADFFFGEIQDRVAAVALIAGVDQGVEGERVVFGRGDLFFYKGAEDAELNGVEMHV